MPGLPPNHEFFRVARIAAAVLLAACAGSLPDHLARAQQGDLSALRRAVREDDSPAKPPADDDGKNRRDQHRHDDCDDDTWLTISGKGAFWIVASPYWGPRAVLEGDLIGDRYFGRAPYSLVDGYMTGAPPDTGTSHCWSGRLSVDYATDFDDLSRVGGQLLLSTVTRFDIDTTAVRWREDATVASKDELWLGDFNLVYRFAQNDHVQFRSGLGFNWLDDASDSEFGFNFTYGADFFPCRPWVISAALDWGLLGHAELFHGTVTLGAVWGPVEVFTGYDYYNIGDVEVAGLVGGVRFWF